MYKVDYFVVDYFAHSDIWLLRPKADTVYCVIQSRFVHHTGRPWTLRIKESIDWIQDRSVNLKCYLKIR